MPRKDDMAPEKLVSTQATVGMVVAFLFLVFGLVLAVVVLRETPSSEPGLLLVMGFFWLIWVVVCVALLRFFARMRRVARSSTLKSFAVKVEKTSLANGPEAAEDFDVRLRKLEKLRREGLVTDREYAAKRAEIMREKW